MTNFNSQNFFTLLNILAHSIHICTAQLKLRFLSTTPRFKKKATKKLKVCQNQQFYCHAFTNIMNICIKNMQNNYLLFPLCQQQNAAISVILTPFFYSVAVHDPNCQLNVALNGSRNIFNTTTTTKTQR